MAHWKDSKLLSYQKAYEAELTKKELRLTSHLNVTQGDTVDESSETALPTNLNLFTHILRSGNTYPSRPQRRVFTNKTLTPTNPSANMPDNVPQPQAPLKILPTEASVRRYSGEDEGYTARTYLKTCEDVMRNAGTTAPAEKIAFVRSRVAPNSRAERLLHGAIFSEEIILGSYDTFKEIFLNAFGRGADVTLLKQIVQMADGMTTNAATLDNWDWCIPMQNVVDTLLPILKKEGWTSDNDTNMPMTRVVKLIQLIVGMVYARPKVRKAALSLEYKPDDMITTVFSKVQNKLMEKEGATAVAVASIPSSDDPSPSYAAAVAKKQKVACDYCHKVGHTSKRCLKRKKDQSNHTSMKDDWTTKPASWGATPSVRPKTTPRMSSVPEAAGKTGQPRSYHCIVHGPQSTHSTDRCYQLQKLRDAVEQKRHSGGRPSGEASRPGAHNPG